MRAEHVRHLRPPAAPREHKRRQRDGREGELHVRRDERAARLREDAQSLEPEAHAFEARRGDARRAAKRLTTVAVGTRRELRAEPLAAEDAPEERLALFARPKTAETAMRRDRRRERYVENVEGRATGDGPERAERDRVNAALGRAVDENRDSRDAKTRRARRGAFFRVVTRGDVVVAAPRRLGEVRLRVEREAHRDSSRCDRAPGREPCYLCARRERGRDARRGGRRDAARRHGPDGSETTPKTKTRLKTRDLTRVERLVGFPSAASRERGSHERNLRATRRRDDARCRRHDRRGVA